MTVRKTAYDTTACQDYLMKRTADAVVVANTHGALANEPGSTWAIRQIQGGQAVVEDIPAFAHPMALVTGHDAVEVVVDVRQFGKFDPMQQQFYVRNSTEYKLAMIRAKLNYVWLTEQPNILRDISPMPMSLFSSWISENCARRWGLDPKEQFQLAILAAIWYNSQFTDATELNEREKLSLVTAISRNLRAQAQDVLEIVDAHPIIASLVHFCQLAPEVTGSVRLAELNPGVLMAILGGTWFGSNAKEMVAVALEHPPTWLAIVLHAITDRSMKNSAITKITERSSFNQEKKNFSHSVQQLLGATTGQ